MSHVFPMSRRVARARAHRCLWLGGFEQGGAGFSCIAVYDRNTGHIISVCSRPLDTVWEERPGKPCEQKIIRASADRSKSEPKQPCRVSGYVCLAVCVCQLSGCYLRNDDVVVAKVFPF